VDALKQIPSLLAHLSNPDSKFRNKEPDGTIFINRSPKHFAEILNIATNPQNSSLWHLPVDQQERTDLLEEADFYSLPPEIIEALKTKVAEKEDVVKKEINDLKGQIAALKKELDTSIEAHARESREKNDLLALASESAIHTMGCYISISDVSFSLRVNKDMTKIAWSGNRSLEKVNATPYYGKPNYEMRPVGAQEANVVLWNNAKSYVLCERKSETHSGLRIDLCSMGNGELLVILEGGLAGPAGGAGGGIAMTSTSPPSRYESSNHLPPTSPSKAHSEERFMMASALHKPGMPTFQRIVCRFQPDPK